MPSQAGGTPHPIPKTNDPTSSGFLATSNHAHFGLVVEDCEMESHQFFTRHSSGSDISFPLLSQTANMKTMLAVLGVSATVIALYATTRDSGYVAHEWGTFTSVQGSDGVQMDWNPHNISDLPSFVYEMNGVHTGSKGAIALKFGMSYRQRMETPVIYFYSDQQRKVDVSVDFPEGVITEWYPHRDAADLTLKIGRTAVNPNRAALEWKNLQIEPSHVSERDYPLPYDYSESHYYPARETDASLVRIASEGGKVETEKFLFYRGTGNFTAPLNVQVDPVYTNQLVITNTGQEELRSLFIYEVTEKGSAWQPMVSLKPGETRKISLDASTSTDSAGLAEALRSAVVAEGLYKKEAASMVKTWETSWLGERGVRVLYTLPRVWTDRILPLKINPAPKAIERVMVGRAEVITPKMEKALLSQVEAFILADPVGRARIVEETRTLQLGRFIEPTMRRIIGGEDRSKAQIAASWQLLNAVISPVAPPKTPAIASRG